MLSIMSLLPRGTMVISPHDFVPSLINKEAPRGKLLTYDWLSQQAVNVHAIHTCRSNEHYIDIHGNLLIVIQCLEVLTAATDDSIR